MTEDFCRRTERRIRRIGYGPKRARHLARHLFIFMTSVCGIMGAAPAPAGRGGDGEPGKFPRRTVPLPCAQIPAETGTGIAAPGPRAVYLAPGYSRIQRR